MSDTAHKIARLVADVTGTPWAITPDALGRLVAVLEVRATGQRLSEQEIRAAVATREARPVDRQPTRGVGLLLVHGILGQRMNLPLHMSGGTSTEQLAPQFRDLLADDTVGTIVLVFDTPGGSVYGVDELATEIRAARGRKPIVAIISSLCASAGYWLAAQADRIVCTSGGDVGSIGIITAHEDVSAMQDKLGVKTTLITAGRFKGEGSPFEPLTADARANLQRRVDECYDRFVGAVAAGRGVREDAVRTGFGEGRLVSARDALAAGMVDAIGTLDELLAELATTQSVTGRTRSPREAARRQAVVTDHWQARVALELRLLDL
jgi:signal peptide peptidase SppA